MEKVLKGKGCLKITGILMIIAGIVEIVFSGIVALVLAIIGLFTVATVVPDTVGETVKDIAAAGSVIFIISAIIAIIGGILELIAGIVGVKNAARPERYKRCIVWGIIVLILNVISIVFGFISSSVDMYNWMFIISIIFGIIIPVIFIIGALINRRASMKGATSVDWAREQLAIAEKKYEAQKVKMEAQAKRKEEKMQRMQEKEAQKAEREAARLEKEAAKRAEEEARARAKAEAEAAAAAQAAAAQAVVPPVENIMPEAAQTPVEPATAFTPEATATATPYTPEPAVASGQEANLPYSAAPSEFAPYDPFASAADAPAAAPQTADIPVAPAEPDIPVAPAVSDMPQAVESIIETPAPELPEAGGSVYAGAQEALAEAAPQAEQVVNNADPFNKFNE